MNKTLKEIQSELKVWTEYNFGKPEPEIPIFGMIEELGELSHAILKEKQGIRQSDFLADKKDAIADLTIYVLNYCNLKEIIVEEDYKHNVAIDVTTINILQNISYYISCINTEGIQLDIFYNQNIINNIKVICDIINIDFLTTVNEVWEQVKLRDWKKYPKDGKTN